MRACIHRGAHEIGGTCIELEHDGFRLVLDIGLPLPGGDDGESLFPAVSGLREGDPSIVGLIVSHGHPDHYGFVSEVHAAVPRYLRIPTEVGQGFRSKWTTDSGRSGPGIPEEGGQAFRGSGPAIPADVDHLPGGVEADAG